MALRHPARLASISAVLLGCAAGGAAPPIGSGGATGGGAVGGGSGGAMAGSDGATADSGAKAVGSGGAGGAATGPSGTGGMPGDAAAGPASDGNTNGEVAVAGCPTGALVCEDFEEYAVAADVTAGGWSKTETAATLQVDATKPFAGMRSLHLAGAGGGAKYAALLVRQGAPLFPIAGNSFYGRMMVWLTDAPAGVHFNNVIASGTLAGSTEVARYGFGALAAKATAAYTVRVTPTAMPSIDCYLPGGAAVPTKRWVCLEWKFDGTNNEMHEWFDGASASDVVKTAGTCAAGAAPVWSAPTFSDIQLGWFQNQPSTVPLEMWIDDIAIDATQRVGCPMK